MDFLYHRPLLLVAAQTAPRDRFIGWSDAQRRDHMHRIVSNARFLILPWVRLKGLASKILGRIARQLPDDWQQRNGYRPVLLETLVQSDRFRGTGYEAAVSLSLLGDALAQARAGLATADHGRVQRALDQAGAELDAAHGYLAIARDEAQALHRAARTGAAA